MGDLVTLAIYQDRKLDGWTNRTEADAARHRTWLAYKHIERRRINARKNGEDLPDDLKDLKGLAELDQYFADHLAIRGKAKSRPVLL